MENRKWNVCGPETSIHTFFQISCIARQRNLPRWATIIGQEPQHPFQDIQTRAGGTTPLPGQLQSDVKHDLLFRVAKVGGSHFPPLLGQSKSDERHYLLFRAAKIRWTSLPPFQDSQNWVGITTPYQGSQNQMGVTTPLLGQPKIGCQSLLTFTAIKIR